MMRKILDGSMGALLSQLNIPDQAFGKFPHLYDVLNISSPEIIEQQHCLYLQAGAEIIETNTFNASQHYLHNNHCGQFTFQINEQGAKIAKQACSRVNPEALVAGSIGPGDKIPSLGHISYTDLEESYIEQISGLIAGGVDLLTIETCQDILQVKAALNAAFYVCDRTRTVPISVALTTDTHGNLITGASIEAAVASLASYDITYLGLNCSLGPQQLVPIYKRLVNVWSGKTIFYPNAGLPVIKDGNVIYDLDAHQYVAIMKTLLTTHHVDIIGGCCGTTPEYIKLLKQTTHDLPSQEQPHREHSAHIASQYRVLDIHQTPPPLFIGERANVAGGKLFKKAILNDDISSALEIIKQQEYSGSHAFDLCIDHNHINGPQRIGKLSQEASLHCSLPMVIDSTDLSTIEAALQHYAGRAIINSVSLQNGADSFITACKIAKKYGAMIICQTIDQQGMAKTVQHKLTCASAMIALAINQASLQTNDIIIDFLTFSIANSQDDCHLAQLTIQAIKAFKQTNPTIATILGISNISFGLLPQARKILNAVFLYHTVQAGLDAAIVNTKQLVAYHEIPDEELQRAHDLLFTDPSRYLEALDNYVSYFHNKHVKKSDTIEQRAQHTPEQLLHNAIMQGKENRLATLIHESTLDPTALVHKVIQPAMLETGKLFSNGSLPYPFVLKSAQVVQTALQILEPLLKQAAQPEKKFTIAMATVKGDLHDIGKNLTSLLLECQGVSVIDLGTDVDYEKLLYTIKHHQIDAIGLSGLLTPSLQVIKEYVSTLSENNYTIPILVGGAAVDKQWVENELTPIHAQHHVYYCKDAFTAYHLLNHDLASHTIHASPMKEQETTTSVMQPIPYNPPPLPKQERMCLSPDCEHLLPLFNKQRLFISRWKFKTSQRTTTNDIYYQEAQALFEKLSELVINKRIFAPQAVLQWFPILKNDHTVTIDGTNKMFQFPKHKANTPIRFIQDHDVLGLYALHCGNGIITEEKQILLQHDYLNYFLLHGFAAELTEVFASWVHSKLMELVDVHANDDTSHTSGRRYSFGYPSMPKLNQQADLLDLLLAEDIGLSVTENHQLQPEFATTGIVICNPAASKRTPS